MIKEKIRDIAEISKPLVGSGIIIFFLLMTNVSENKKSLAKKNIKDNHEVCYMGKDSFVKAEDSFSTIRSFFHKFL